MAININGIELTSGQYSEYNQLRERVKNFSELSSLDSRIQALEDKLRHIVDESGNALRPLLWDMVQWHGSALSPELLAEAVALQLTENIEKGSSLH